MRLFWSKFAWRNWLSSAQNAEAGFGPDPDSLMIDGDVVTIDGSTIEFILTPT